MSAWSEAPGALAELQMRPGLAAPLLASVPTVLTPMASTHGVRGRACNGALSWNSFALVAEKYPSDVRLWDEKRTSATVLQDAFMMRSNA